MAGRRHLSELEKVLAEPPVPERPWDDPIHKSLRGPWWLAEFIPKWQWDEAERRKRLKIGRGARFRHIKDGELIDRSALLRLREIDYSPPGISARFISQVRELTDVPEVLPYVA